MITKQIRPLFNGFQWLLQSNQGPSLSIIFHDGSYGRAEGLFETQRSWKSNVQGRLTFGQVQQAINTLERLDKKLENQNV